MKYGTETKLVHRRGTLESPRERDVRVATYALEGEIEVLRDKIADAEDGWFRTRASRTASAARELEIKRLERDSRKLKRALTVLKEEK